MKLNKQSFAIADMCSTKKWDSGITGLYITGSETIATNGSALVRVRHQETDDSFSPIIIDAKSANRIAKSIKDNTTSPTNVNGSVSFELPNETIKASVIEGRFPDVDVVMPDKSDMISFNINAKLLSDVLCLLVTGKDLENKQVKFYVKDSESPIMIEKNRWEHNMTAVVMPCKP